MKAIIPASLQELDQWIYWRSTIRDGRPTKVPCNLAGHDRSVTDPKNWITFEDAVSGYAEHADSLAGFGFCFAKGGGYTGVDTDGSLPRFTPEVAEIIARLQTYGEVSPSGKGIKFIGRATKPEGAKSKVFTVPGLSQLEVYDSNRFFTITGNMFGIYDECEDIQDTVDWLMETYGFLPGEKHATASIPKAVEGASSLLERAVGFEGTDEQVIALLCEEPKYERLWNGDASDYATQDRPEGDLSSADGALVEKIAWLVGPVPERIDRIFRASGLFREEKWDRSGDDYGERTIRFALSGKTDFYRGGGSPPEKPLASGDDGEKPYVLVNLRDVQAERVNWHFKDFIPKGIPMMLSSPGGVVKGLYIMHVASEYIDGPVLYLSAEDNLAMIIKPRAEAAGVDYERFSVLREVRYSDDTTAPIRFPAHADVLRETVRDTGARLVVIDAGPEHMEEGLKGNSTEDVRAFMAPLNSIAEEENVTILLILHTNKTQGASSTDRVSGSRAWVDAQRHVLMAAIDDEDEDVRHVQVHKSNIGKQGVGRQFRILTKPVMVYDRDLDDMVEDQIPYLVDEGVSLKDVDALLSAKRPDKDSTIDKAILEYLDAQGRTLSKKVDVDVSMSTGKAERTIRNHRMELAANEYIRHEKDITMTDGRIEQWYAAITTEGMGWLHELAIPEEEW